MVPTLVNSRNKFLYVKKIHLCKWKTIEVKFVQSTWFNRLLCFKLIPETMIGMTLVCPSISAVYMLQWSRPEARSIWRSNRPACWEKEQTDQATCKQTHSLGCCRPFYSARRLTGNMLKSRLHDPGFQLPLQKSVTQNKARRIRLGLLWHSVNQFTVLAIRTWYTKCTSSQWPNPDRCFLVAAVFFTPLSAQMASYPCQGCTALDFSSCCVNQQQRT